MEATEHAADEVLPPPPVAGLEIAGFLLNPETQSALEALDTSNLPPMPGRRVLLLSRDDFPHDAKLVRSLEQAGCALTARTGVGYTAMMGLPHEAVPPVESGEIIVEFLQAGIAHNQNDLPSAKEAIPASSFEHGVIETICPLTTAAGTIFSILTEPPAGSLRSDWCLLFLNSGGVRHIGSNRMWVEAARRWATLGIPSLRMDFHKVGESDGDPNLSVESLYQDDLVQQLGSAIANLRMRLDSHRFLAIGLCSGAYAAFQGALHNPAIRGAILLNPRLFFWDPAVDQRRLNRRVVTGLGDASDWLRLARGEIQPDRLKEAARVVFQKLLRNGHSNNREPQIPREAMARAWSTVERFGTRLTLVFAAGEPLLQEMEEEGQLPPATNPLIRCVRVQKVGHTFRSLWAQKQAQEIIDREIDLILHTDRPSDRPNFHLAQPFSSNFAGT
jgi:dienelactone hydrolase